MKSKKNKELEDSLKPFMDGKLSEKKVPIVYRKEYNISFMGFEKMHSFDSCKFGNIASALKKVHKVVGKTSFFIKSRKIEDGIVEKYHEKQYLDGLKDLEKVGKIVEIDLKSIVERFPLLDKLNPMKIVEKVLVNGFKHQAGGVVLAGEISRIYGFCFVLGGGMHHCSAGKGGGWCMFNDIGMSILNLKEKKKVKYVAFVDLDAHQGNGYENDVLNGKLGNKDEIYIMDVYNKYNFPGDSYAKEAINCNIPIHKKTTTEEYLKLVRSGLKRLIREFPNVEIVYYNAGSDILFGDSLGGLKINDNGLIERDLIVFKFFLSRGIPIVYMTAGGYSQKSASVVGRSISNIYEKLNLWEFAKINYKKNYLKKEIDEDPKELIKKDEKIDEVDERYFEQYKVDNENVGNSFYSQDHSIERNDYSKELQTLKEMGFPDESVNLMILRQVGGDIQRVVEFLSNI